MQYEYQVIRLRTLDKMANEAERVRKLGKPPLGWLRSVREGLGLSLRDVARMIRGISPQAVHDFEKNEAAGTLSLRNFERVAAAMGCRVVSVLVPERDGQTFTELAAGHSGGRRLLEDTDHTMTLEAQDVGDFDERVKRGIRRHGKR
jgi:predicted DNA-binding mobile mystery protein A